MKVYLCGGINGLSDDACKAWRAEAAKHFEVLDPMRRDYRGHEETNATTIVHADLEDIAACDVVLVKATHPSWGTAMEIAYAYLEDKPVVAFTGPIFQVSPWLRHHCVHIFATLDEAIQEVKSYDVSHRA